MSTGLARVELAADAIEPGGEQSAHSQIGIAAVVDRFEFQVGGGGLAPPEGRRNTDSALPIIKTIGGIGGSSKSAAGGRRYELGLAQVRATRAGRWARTPPMKWKPSLTQAATPSGVKQQVRASMGRAGQPPEAAMDVGATASLIQEGLGSKRGDNTMLEGHTAHGLTHRAAQLSAARRASAWWIESSCWPGPSSGINCSTWIPCCSRAAIMSSMM